MHTSDLMQDSSPPKSKVLVLGLKMDSLRSSTSSSNHAFSSHLKSSFLHILYSSIYLLNFATNAYGFKLPINEIYRNSSCGSRTVRLNINDFGAKGDGFTDDTKCLQDVWKVACSLSSPAKIVIPAGNFYLFRPINFVGPCRSKVTLKVAGTIFAPNDPQAWEGLDMHKWLYFHDVNNLKIEGRGMVERRGMIDGQGLKWWERSCPNNDSNPCMHAPTAVTFHKCNNLKLRNLNLVFSPHTHMAFTHCNHVSASSITIMAPADRPNTNGIHISSSTNVELKDIIIATGGDCVSIVSNSSKIHMKNILCQPGHGISIGSLGKHNSYDSVQDVIVSGAVLSNTANGVRIKTCQGGRGSVRKVTFEDIWMKNVSNPIVIDQYYCDSLMSACPNQTSAVSIDTISFRGIKGTSATEEAIKFACSDSYPCRRLYLENINLATSSGTAKSFCWKAYGTSSGMVYPPSCVTSGDIIIQHQVNYNSTRWNKDYHSLF